MYRWKRRIYIHGEARRKIKGELDVEATVRV